MIKILILIFLLKLNFIIKYYKLNNYTNNMINKFLSLFFNIFLSFFVIYGSVLISKSEL
jgi:hypothetical protein